MKFSVRYLRMLALLLGALLTLVGPAFADSLAPYSFVGQSTQQDGDSIATSQVSVGVCPGTSCPTLLSAAITDKTSRRRVFVNTSSYAVYIGTNSTTLTTTGYKITESTGTSPTFATYNTAAYYAVAVSTGTVAVLKEYNSKP